MTDPCGIILAGGNGKRLSPLTRSINKHLLPVYDKPMIYYPLSTLMMAGIRDIAVITRKEDLVLYSHLLGDGSAYGISLTFIAQNEANGIPEGYVLAKSFIGKRNIALILGDNILLGQGLGKNLEFSTEISGAKIFAFPVNNPQDYGVVTLDPSTGQVISLVEKPINPKSNLAIPGLYFTDNQAVEVAESLSKSARGEFEISDLLNWYLERDQLQVSSFRRGIGWMDAGSVQSLYAASELVSVLQKRQGLRFACPEEIAWGSGWISNAELEKQAFKYVGSDYGSYLMSLLK
jgi:glucose-1-phosphate thymidylyltransferase